MNAVVAGDFANGDVVNDGCSVVACINKDVAARSSGGRLERYDARACCGYKAVRRAAYRAIRI